MKKMLLLMLAISLAGLIYNCTDQKTEVITETEVEEPSPEEIVKRGEYLVTIMGCADCHTPKKMTDHGPEPDMDRWLMGHPSENELPPIDKTQIEPGKWALLNSDLTAAAGPWGVSFAGNLTPHETGLGNWTFDHFKRAFTEGKFKGMEEGRPLMPPMPWQNYRVMTEEDLVAVFEYLKSIPPIENVVPSYIPPNEIQ